MMALTLLPSSAVAKVSCMHFPTSITRTLALFCQGVRVAFEGRPTASSKVPKHDVDVAASILSMAMVGVRSSIESFESSDESFLGPPSHLFEVGSDAQG